MTEQELLNEVKKSAEEIQIPDSLTPESMSTKLKTLKKPRKQTYFSMKRTVSAAAVLLLCSMLSAGAYQMKISQPEQDFCLYTEESKESLSGNSREAADGSNELTESTQGVDSDYASKPKQDAGSLYTIAKSYDQIYELLESGSSREAAGLSNGAASFATTDEASAEIMASADSAKSSALKNESYSSTNLQTEGVDESDTVKTDGRYIYTLTGARVAITDTAGGSLTRAGSVTPTLGAADHILEFYVDENMLFVLTEHYETVLENRIPEAETETTYLDSDTTGFIPLENYQSCDSVWENYYYSTMLYAYDISDPANPILSGTASQEGYYQTSRKIGNMIYLFTQKTLALPASYEGETKGGIIPCINGEEIPCDHIYVSEEGNEGLILSSFDTTDMTNPKDTIMVLHSYADIYVGTDSIYLYHSQYGNTGYLSQIAKFSMDNGILNAVNSATVKGQIYDTFAINETNGTLRVLTTYNNASGNTDNSLYLFDKDLNLTGSLTGIAKGEEVYAARYLGNTAYFITYRNTDPLFAVDLTDTSNPVLLGQLEVTGFSEYLHFWEDGKLLGLGYETDPVSGEQKGLKLVMFDISDPTDLNVIDSLVLTDCYYSPGLYHYKCVLADWEKNLIGFATEYSSEFAPYYDLFSWENDHFVQKLHETLPEYEYISYDTIRGIYIGDSFYIACPTIITGYAINTNLEKFAELNLSE